jgi:hypothetical protein
LLGRAFADRWREPLAQLLAEPLRVERDLYELKLVIT